MENKTLSRFLLLSSSVLVGTLFLYIFLRYLFWWLLPFLLALLAAAAMEPAVRFLGRKLHFRRSFSAAVLTLFLLFLAGGLLSFFCTTLFSQAQNFLSRFPVLLQDLPALMQELLARIGRYSAASPAWLQAYIEDFFSNLGARGSAALSALASWLLERLGGFASAVPGAVLATATSVLAIYFTSSTYPLLCSAAKRILSGKQQTELKRLASGFSSSLLRWLRAQLCLFSLTFLQLFLGFSLLRFDFALLAAFLTALVDMLPVFGTGTVLIPWALLSLLFGGTLRAIALAALYLMTLLVRSIAEPKLISALSGVPPIASLFAMYLGFCTLGVGGMILFPFLLLIISNLWAQKKES